MTEMHGAVRMFFDVGAKSKVTVMRLDAAVDACFSTLCARPLFFETGHVLLQRSRLGLHPADSLRETLHLLVLENTLYNFHPLTLCFACSGLRQKPRVLFLTSRLQSLSQSALLTVVTGCRGEGR